jgi:hypothetical protein
MISSSTIDNPLSIVDFSLSIFYRRMPLPYPACVSGLLPPVTQENIGRNAAPDKGYNVKFGHSKHARNLIGLKQGIILRCI